MTQHLVSIRGLSATVPLASGRARAVEHVDLDVSQSTSIAIVGESGSGKTLTALAIPALPPAGVVYAGSVLVDGRDVSSSSPAELQRLRGRVVGFLFQQTADALDPLVRVGEQIGAPARRHLGLDARVAALRARELLARLAVPDPERAAAAFPHELSGGMRQRAALALALAAEPALLVLDEPTSALDPVSTRILLAEVAAERARRGMASILVTHDLRLVADHVERVVVMYGGRVVEEGPARALFARPAHPYTLGLLRSLPTGARRGRRLAAIDGAPPAIHERPSGCAFRTRCPLARERCANEVPRLEAIESAGLVSESMRRVACFASAEVPVP